MDDHCWLSYIARGYGCVIILRAHARPKATKRAAQGAEKGGVRFPEAAVLPLVSGVKRLNRPCWVNVKARGLLAIRG